MAELNKAVLGAFAYAPFGIAAEMAGNLPLQFYNSCGGLEIFTFLILLRVEQVAAVRHLAKRAAMDSLGESLTLNILRFFNYLIFDWQKFSHPTVLNCLLVLETGKKRSHLSC